MKEALNQNLRKSGSREKETLFKRVLISFLVFKAQATDFETTPLKIDVLST